MDNERWRFEADTTLLQAMEMHYDQYYRTCFHDDEYKCVRHILEFLEARGVVLVPKEWVSEEMPTVQGEVRHAQQAG